MIKKLFVKLLDFIFEVKCPNCRTNMDMYHPSPEIFVCPKCGKRLPETKRN